MRRIKNPLGRGVHLHIGKDIGKLPTTIDAVKSWANKILKEENDMLYMRRKNGVITWVVANRMMGETKWEQLDPADVPTVVGIDGKVIAPAVVEETAEELEFKKILADIPSGWYQDTAAELHHYLGNGDWESVPSNTLKKKMNQALLNGSLDYLG